VEFLAAKVFRPRQFRNLRNDSHYRQGRWELGADGKLVKDRRSLRAIKGGTQVGQAMRFDSWLAHEYWTLEILRAAGCAVPQPFASGGHTIMMSYVGDGVRGAPTLSEVRLSRTEAGPLFAKVVANIELMLGAMRIHGDLSAYNILYWEGDVTIIDFPQAVDPYENPAAREIFDRDVRRVCQYFAAQGVPEARDPVALADEVWSRHVTQAEWREAIM
jgi:RIO kinase 1